MTFGKMCTHAMALVLALSVPFVIGQEEACQDLSILGTPNWDRFEGSLDIMVDDDCMYTWTATLKHDVNLPLPDDPANQCNPGLEPPILADDGLPYFGFRWHYLEPSDYFKEVTGISHISFDYNACGHPPIDVYTIPHYDMHTYRITPEFRTCMTCDLIPGTPVCNPAPGEQTTEEGLKFFTPVTRDIPPLFINFESDAVPVMGGHAWDPAQQPLMASEWDEPVMICGYYDDTFLYYEPMPPLTFMTGDTDNFWETELSYNNQTITELATYASVSYNATTGFTTFTYKGPSAVCNTEAPSTTPTTTPSASPTIRSGSILGIWMTLCLAGVSVAWS